MVKKRKTRVEKRVPQAPLDVETLTHMRSFIAVKLRKAYPFAGSFQNYRATTEAARAEHLVWMLEQVWVLIKKDDLEKASRYLTHVDGAMWGMQVKSMDDVLYPPEDRLL